MNDIPMFTSEYGVASLTLRQIPLRQEAYIHIQATEAPDALLQECIGFCRACGAEKIYASGHDSLETFPLYASVVKMACPKEKLPESNAALFPVTEQTLETWLEIYRRRMAPVPNASGMSLRDGRQMLKEGDGYFVHKDGVLLGIGRASGDKVTVVIAEQRGAGQQVLCALAELLHSDTVYLEVARENKPAVRLYERLGFLCTAERSRWYQVF